MKNMRLILTLTVIRVCHIAKQWDGFYLVSNLQTPNRTLVGLVVPTGVRLGVWRFRTSFETSFYPVFGREIRIY